MKKTHWLYTLFALLMLLTACGNESAAPYTSSSVETPVPQHIDASSSAQAEANSVVSQPEQEPNVLETPMEFPGDHDGERPVITMLAQNYENGNVIEIPQLAWATQEEETTAARSINEKIVSFAEGYEEYLDGHPEGYTCSIQATVHNIGMQIVIIMQKHFSPDNVIEPEIAVFAYDWVLELEYGLESAGQTDLTQEEIINKVTEQAATQDELTVSDCELTDYAWVDFGELYFYHVTVQNAEGVELNQTWAWLEESFLDEFDDVMRGEDAFALLKQTYPDMPPDFN